MTGSTSSKSRAGSVSLTNLLDNQACSASPAHNVLRRKLLARGIVRPGVRLSDDVAVAALIETGIITTTDLDRIDDPAWCSRQADLLTM